MERLNIVVVGPGASGKDFFRKNLLSLGYKPSISYTTRPPREGEEDSIDYHFVCKEDFVNMIGDSFFYEWNYFAKSWYYGTPKSAFDGRYNLFIMTPSGVSALSEEHRAKSIVVYINPEENVRKTRLLDGMVSRFIFGAVRLMKNNLFSGFHGQELSIELQVKFLEALVFLFVRRSK